MIKRLVRAKEGAAVVAPSEVIEITGTWNAEELMKIFDTMERLQEAIR